MIKLTGESNGESKTSFGWRRWSSLFAAVTGSILTLLATYSGYSVALLEYRKQFNYDAQSRSTLIHNYLDERVGDLDSLRRFIEGTDTLSRAAFRDFVKPLLDRPGIQALEWIPAVPEARRSQVESRAIHDGLSGFHFSEKTATGEVVPAARRDFYYPVYYVEPLQGNGKALGFDLGSNPVRLEAIRQAEATNRPHATAPLTLVQERGPQTGVLIFAPIEATVAGEHSFALGVFRAGDMLAAALTPTLGAPLDTTLSDLSGAAGSQTLSQWRKKEGATVQRDWKLLSSLFPLPVLTSEIPFAGRRWEVRTKATPEYRAETVSLLFLAIFPGGMLITALVALYMKKLLKHSHEVELLVAERTAALQQSEARHRTLFEATSDAIFVINQETIFDCNPAALRVFGSSSREDLLGKRPDELSPLAQLNGEESCVAGKRKVEQALTEGVQRFEWLHSRLDTHENFIAEVCLTPMELNRQIFVQATVRDITQRKQAERELQENRETLSLILNSTAEAIYGIDRNGCCTFCNQSCLYLLGYDREQELLGKNMHDLIHHTHVDGSPFPVHICRIFKAFQSGEGTHVDDELLWRKDGSSFPSEYWSYPQFRNGEIVGAVVTFFNISERKQAEAALFDHQQQLLTINLTLEQRIRDEVQKNRDKDYILLQRDKLASIGQLAAGVAHEINNPLSFITSNLRSLNQYFTQMARFDQIRQQNSEELPLPTQKSIGESRESLDIDYIITEGVDLINESLAGAERVRRIVLDLKNFSRVDTPEQEAVALDSCLESALNICYNDLKYVATIRKEYESLPEVLCHPGQLNQVFLNLLVNAGQAITTPKPGEIVLHCWHDAAFVYASVSDTGKGIPEEIQGRIFDPFFTTKDVGQGTGLGLSISYEIVKKHQGELLVESVVGKGTTFTVKLPRSPIQAPG